MKTKELKHRQAHRWGYMGSGFKLDPQGVFSFESDRAEYQFFSNQALPDFIPFVEEVLGISFDTTAKNQEIPSKALTKSKRQVSFSKAIADKFPNTQISYDDLDRLVHSHGQTTTDEVYKILYQGCLPKVVDMVFYPTSQKDVLQIISLAQKHNVCLVPYGGGTSVSNALVLPTKEKRMIVSVDMRRMNRILWIDNQNMLACVQAGIVGIDLHQQLVRKGFVLGHEPDSIEFSTLGGWIATYASGMKKNKYGNIEDLVKDFNFVTPTGVISNQAAFDRSSIGLQPKGLVLGNEGNFGIVTQAVIKIHNKPEVQKYNSLIFPNIQKGIACLRELSFSNYIPASIRLVDNEQFRFGLSLKPAASNLWERLRDKFKKFFLLQVKKLDPKQMCLSTIVMEGDSAEVTHQEKSITALSKKYGAIVAGPINGKRGYLLTNLIAYIRDFLSDYHCIGETLESTVPWSCIEVVCEAAKKTVIREHKKYKLQGKPYFSYRITQLYHSSVCIYFTVGLITKNVSKPELVFSKIEKEIRQAILKHGGSISHHHGIGKIRQQTFIKHSCKNVIASQKQIKKQLDPKNIFGIRNNLLN